MNVIQIPTELNLKSQFEKTKSQFEQAVGGCDLYYFYTFELATHEERMKDLEEITTAFFQPFRLNDDAMKFFCTSLYNQFLSASDCIAKRSTETLSYDAVRAEHQEQVRKICSYALTFKTGIINSQNTPAFIQTGFPNPRNG